MTDSLLPPERLLPGIGFGDFEAIGTETVGLIRRFAGLGAADRVLDIGCGLGRIARPLLDALPGVFRGPTARSP